ncbi:2OG-Fe(II) oxygenase family protein [Terricaulis sp.]|uniref:2OG-Fe(II) oxygenase family protein n=1 Tax=Terricaulis sp. TaxID=2768686 RepID=UPI003783593B
MADAILKPGQSDEIAESLRLNRYAVVSVPDAISTPLRKIHLAAESLFATSGEVKSRLSVSPSDACVFGYQRFTGSSPEEQGLDRSYETFDWTTAKRASSEFVLSLPQQASLLTPGLMEALHEYGSTLIALQREILSSLVPDQMLGPFQSDPLSVLRLIRYSELSAHSPIPAHTDYEWFSVTNSTREGLEVLTPAGWQSVDAGPNSFVILAGNCLEIWTEGEFKSCRHRVLQTGGKKPRQSIVHFANLDASAARAISDAAYRAIIGAPVFVPIKWVQKFYVRNVPELYRLATEGRFPELLPIPDRNPITGEA